jgi:hypothetical protein
MPADSAMAGCQPVGAAVTAAPRVVHSAGAVRDSGSIGEQARAPVTWRAVTCAIVHGLVGAVSLGLGLAHIVVVTLRFFGPGLSEGAAPFFVQLLIGAFVIGPSLSVLATTPRLVHGSGRSHALAATGVLLAAMLALLLVFASGMAKNLLFLAFLDGLVLFILGMGEVRPRAARPTRG